MTVCALVYIMCEHIADLKSRMGVCNLFLVEIKSKKISNDQELIQSDPTSCPQNQKENN